MANSSKQPINKRALTSLLLFFSFLFLPVSGIPLHFFRASESVTALEHFLMSVHNMSALLFVAAALVHLTFNWKAISKYMAEKTQCYLKFRKEMIIALLIIVIMVGLFSAHAFHVQ